MTKKKVGKPTGRTQRAVVSSNSVQIEFREFPFSKEGIEEKMASVYADAAANVGVEVAILKQNDTSDLDFEATFAGTRVYLELTEIAFLKRGGYETAPLNYEIIPFAKQIADQINKKAKMYQGVRTPIILLLYTTDFRFHVAPQALEHLQYLMRDGLHKLSRIELLEPRANGDGIVNTIYPIQGRDWKDYDPLKYKGHGIAVADLSKPLPRSKWPGGTSNNEA